MMSRMKVRRVREDLYEGFFCIFASGEFKIVEIDREGCKYAPPVVGIHLNQGRGSLYETGFQDRSEVCVQVTKVRRTSENARVPRCIGRPSGASTRHYKLGADERGLRAVGLGEGK